MFQTTILYKYHDKTGFLPPAIEKDKDSVIAKRRDMISAMKTV